MPFDIVLVDDHKLVRDGVRTILERGAEFHVVGEAENGADAVQLCKKTQPDLVLMDIGLPGMNGIEATTELLRHCPRVKVVILSMYDDENSVVSAIRSGARAFVLKKASSERVAGRAAHGGARRVVPELAGVRPAAAAHPARRSGHARPQSAGIAFAARTAGAAAGGRRKDEQGYRGAARSRAADRAQLSQDDDEEARRQQCRRADAARAGRRHHALEQARCKHPGVTSPSATRTSISFLARFFQIAGGAVRQDLPDVAAKLGLGTAAGGSDADWRDTLGRGAGCARRRARRADRQHSGRRGVGAGGRERRVPTASSRTPWSIRLAENAAGARRGSAGDLPVSRDAPLFAARRRAWSR